MLDFFEQSNKQNYNLNQLKKLITNEINNESDNLEHTKEEQEKLIKLRQKQIKKWKKKLNKRKQG